MHVVLLILVFFTLVFGPQLWARWVFARHSRHDDRFPGTGGELARHLINQLELKDVKVEKTALGDHYDPRDKAVRLSEENFDGRSLTAVAVAAHEVGHALQDHTGYRPLALRSRVITAVQGAEKLGAALLLAIPVLALITRTPSASLLIGLVGIGSLGLVTLAHLATLPVEWDASFGRALPLLRAGRYIQPHQEPAVRRILRAAALTYLAASLASLLNLSRWITILRR